MAWFECTVGKGGSSGDGADLIVTCSQNFAGKVITCTDGTVTFTQQCPSTSPYVVTFESIPTGTWTISGVISGQTFSTTKTITDFTATLADIPDGATVTPTDVIQTWLHCANIWDKTYTTINQVLSDTTTLLALISSSNAVDYMARSTSWTASVSANSTAMTYIGNNDYCANSLLANSSWRSSLCNSTYFENVLKAKVPTMTSNTAPSGEAYGSSVYSSSNYYLGFDGNDTTAWIAATGDRIGAFLAYDFGSAKKIYKIEFIESVNGAYYSVKSFKIQASNSKTSGWVDITGSITVSTHDGQAHYEVIYSSTKYRYWRFYVEDNWGGTSYMGVELKTLQFWGRA